MSLSAYLRLAALAGLAAATVTTPAVARHHRPAPAATHHHRAATGHHAAAPKRRTHPGKPEPQAAPHGGTTVPADGLKVYCRRGTPLLVRKMTQGAGTTVTVLCR